MKSVVIRTRDIAKSIEFYEKIMGFTFDSMISPSPGKQIAFLVDPQSCGKLELLYNEAGKANAAGGVSITFNVNTAAVHAESIKIRHFIDFLHVYVCVRQYSTPERQKQVFLEVRRDFSRRNIP